MVGHALTLGYDDKEVDVIFFHARQVLFLPGKVVPGECEEFTIQDLLALVQVTLEDNTFTV